MVIGKEEFLSRSWTSTPIGVWNGPCEHLRAWEHCVLFCAEHEQGSNFFLRAPSTLENIQLAW